MPAHHVALYIAYGQIIDEGEKEEAEPVTDNEQDMSMAAQAARFLK